MRGRTTARIAASSSWEATTFSRASSSWRGAWTPCACSAPVSPSRRAPAAVAFPPASPAGVDPAQVHVVLSQKALAVVTVVGEGRELGELVAEPQPDRARIGRKCKVLGLSLDDLYEIVLPASQPDDLAGS